MLPTVSNEPGKAHFKVTMSWAAAMEGMSQSTWVLMGLKADLGFVACVQILLALRTGRGCLVLDREGLLGFVLLMMLLMGSLNWTVFVFAVFLKPLWRELLQERESALWQG